MKNRKPAKNINSISSLITQKAKTPDLKNILLQGNYIDGKVLKNAEYLAEKNKISLQDYLLSNGLITQNLLNQAFAESYQIDYVDLRSNPPKTGQIIRITEELATKYHLIFVNETDTEVIIATDDPLISDELKNKLEKIFKDKKLILAYSSTSDIQSALMLYKKPLEVRFSEIVAANTKVANEIVKEIIYDSTVFNASDIHFEPQEKDVLVRLRIDGILTEAGTVTKEIYKDIVKLIKTHAHLSVEQPTIAQDGTIRFAKDDGHIDMRVSIIPTLEGETIVIRLLAKYVKDFTFSDLGISERNRDVYIEVSKKPFGMVLVTGPSGSGKSTTLYSLIKRFNTPEVNITTIEDPVEYIIPRINQIQVNSQGGLTFARGLRSIVRQDPDIVLVGEIRDVETAEIAVNAALTGHLLFSSFHSNDASTAIPRLLSMGIEPFMLASALELVISQRLVRRICNQCKISFIPSQQEMENLLPNFREFFTETDLLLYKGKGCTSCSHTGYKNRTAIYEFIHIEKELQDLIMSNPSSQEITEVARKTGSISIFEDGVEKVKNGIITIEELLRVALPPER